MTFVSHNNNRFELKIEFELACSRFRGRHDQRNRTSAPSKHTYKRHAQKGNAVGNNNRKAQPCVL